jgi:hypothetical protein
MFVRSNSYRCGFGAVANGASKRHRTSEMGRFEYERQKLFQHIAQRVSVHEGAQAPTLDNAYRGSCHQVRDPMQNIGLALNKHLPHTAVHRSVESARMILHRSWPVLREQDPRAFHRLSQQTFGAWSESQNRHEVLSPT